jgi:hypothetical protein
MIKIMIYLLQMVIFHGYAKPKGIRIFPRISHDIPPKKKTLFFMGTFLEEIP